MFSFTFNSFVCVMLALIRVFGIRFQCLFSMDYDIMVFQMTRTGYNHTGQCKRTSGCYNELVVAFLRTGDGLKGKKSIPVDFMIYL